MRLGKIDEKIFSEIIYPNLGKRHKEVIVEPQSGVDTGAIDLGDGRVLVVKSDPVFIVPQFGFKKAAWFAVHILASDVMTSGIPPKYALIDLNLPPKIRDEEFKEMWLGIHEALNEINVMVVGGHTGVYEGTDYPMVGGFSMIGIGEKEKLGTPSKVRIGDSIIITKGPAIEATGLLVNLYPEYFRERLPQDIFKEAYDMYWKMSCWKDGLIASNVGIHLMHDATEGGVWNALVEIATVTKKELRIYEDKLFINRAVKEVTSLVNIDPWSSISEGTMIIISDKGEKIVEALKREGIESAIVGEVKEGDGVTLVKKDGSKQRIEKPAEDPFWRVFFELSKKA
ncbi:AIR synthase family protein [Sulfurisphaera tokodaii]|uniref:Hydrogenase expression/formation protein HypE n=2 Tax=Sulfurisphaera tokodaii TaxID=111955 RepID=F9VNH9_SULTO|nr:AIR synthase family protein [Sulfurisphaera tokodaii]BAK54625.1 putative hydrogenase expression/formation protein HypE [Sulfurisphaera tokodaii str. 7]HII73479.1 AIR synthase [Sulfurisphaera tokodaii]